MPGRNLVGGISLGPTNPACGGWRVAFTCGGWCVKKKLVGRKIFKCHEVGG